MYADLVHSAIELDITIILSCLDTLRKSLDYMKSCLTPVSKCLEAQCNDRPPAQDNNAQSSIDDGRSGAQCFLGTGLGFVGDQGQSLGDDFWLNRDDGSEKTVESMI